MSEERDDCINPDSKYVRSNSLAIDAPDVKLPRILDRLGKVGLRYL